MNLIRKESEYAIKIVKLLSNFPDNRILKLKEISDIENISINFAAKILRNLSNKKIVKSFRGSQGGYNLAKKKDKLLWNHQSSSGRNPNSKL